MLRETLDEFLVIEGEFAVEVREVIEVSEVFEGCEGGSGAAFFFGDFFKDGVRLASKNGFKESFWVELFMDVASNEESERCVGETDSSSPSSTSSWKGFRLSG